jgi:acyl carrier protein
MVAPACGGGFLNSDTAIEGQIRTFLNESFPLYRGGALDREESFVESGVLDSLGILELVEFVESRFALRIPEEELLPENLDSLANITRYISNKLSRDEPLRSEVERS